MMVVLIKLYTPATRRKIRDVLEGYLLQIHAPQWIGNLESIVDELIKNGLKANYKYCLIRENIRSALAAQQTGNAQADFSSNRELYNNLAQAFGKPDQVSDFVRKGLSQEARLIQIRGARRTEKRRKMNQAEINILRSAAELMHLRRLVKVYGTEVHFRIDLIGDFIEIDICNNVPMMTADLNRIREKRREFNECADAGQEAYFFANNLDSSGAGSGLGYALIDAGLREMKLDPQVSMNVISTHNTTVSLSLDGRILRHPLRCTPVVIA